MPVSLTFSDIATKTRSGVDCSFIFADNPFRALITRSPTTGDDAIDVILYDESGLVQLSKYLRLYFAQSNATLYFDLAPIASHLLSVDRPAITQLTVPLYFADDYVNVRIGYKYFSDVSYTVDATVYTLLAGAVQIAEDTTYGQNCARYMPDLAFEGQYLTMLSSPRVWWGAGNVYAPVLSHIVPANIVAEQIAVPAGGVVIRQRFDGGAWQYQDYDATDLGVVAHTLFDDGAGTAFYTEVSAAKQVEVEVWWATDLAPITLDTQLIPTLTMPIQEACINPLLLSWKNSKGGFDIWAFVGDRPIETKSKTEANFSVEVTDMATQRATSRVFSKTATETMQATALGLTTPEALALKEILSSPSVLIWKNSVWIYVDVEGSFTVNEYDRTHNLSLNISLPQILTTNG